MFSYTNHILSLGRVMSQSDDVEHQHEQESVPAAPGRYVKHQED